MTGAGATGTGPDAARAKADQCLAWSRAAAGWERWWETLELAGQSVSDRLVDLAHVLAGARVLDVATGIGEPAVTAARRVGPGGSVVAVDQAPQMIAIARRRMASLGLTNLELLEADVDELRLAEPFDAILSRWGLMFLADLDAALRRLAGFLRPRGRLAAAVWGEPEQVPLIALPRTVLRDRFHVAAAPPGMPTPFDLADEGSLRGRFERAGLVNVTGEWRTVAFEFPSARDYAQYVSDVSPSFQALAAQASVPHEELMAALAEEAVRAHATADERIVFENRTLLVAGSRPGGGASEPRGEASGGGGDASAPRVNESGAESDQPAPRVNESGVEGDQPAPRVVASGAGGETSTAVRCPFCGGTDTRLESRFGSTLGFSQHWCAGCRTVFEYLKWEENGPSGPKKSDGPELIL